MKLLLSALAEMFWLPCFSFYLHNKSNYEWKCICVVRFLNVGLVSVSLRDQGMWSKAMWCCACLFKEMSVFIQSLVGLNLDFRTAEEGASRWSASFQRLWWSYKCKWSACSIWTKYLLGFNFVKWEMLEDMLEVAVAFCCGRNGNS